MELSITCPRCGMTSYHPTDVAEGYCGNCHDWTALNADRHRRMRRRDELIGFEACWAVDGDRHCRKPKGHDGDHAFI